MDIRKVWPYAVIALLTLVSAVFYLIILIDLPQFTLASGSGLIGALVFFVGIMLAAIYMMIEKTRDWTKWTLIITGVVATVFTFIQLIEATGRNAVFYSFGLMVVFGLLPLIFGLKMLMCDCVDMMDKKAKGKKAGA